MLARRALILSSLLLLVSSCSNGGDPIDPPVLMVALLDGDDQSVIGNTAVSVDPAVRVTEDGEPKSGVNVTFTIASGGGALVGGNATTNDAGEARVTSWTLGDPGVAQQLNATVSGADGSPVVFTATATTGPAAQVAVVAGDQQDATVGTVADVEPVIQVTDAGGNPVANVPLTWQVTAGDGELIDPDATTGADGTATVGSWVFGEAVGPQGVEVTATCPVACAPVVFAGDATAGPVATLVKLTGDQQVAPAGTAVTLKPSVQLEDIFGNTVSGAPVTFAVALGGGAVTGATPTSDASGIAEVGSWTLGAAGANELTATSNGVTITFTATATALFDPAPFAGSYAGTWTNTTFASMGTGTAVITVNTTNNTATVTATATGNVLGGGPASPPLQNGTFTSTGAQFTGNVAPMGDITATIVPPGTITATGTNVPSGSITGWTANGTINGTTIQLNFTVTFTAGAPAVGTITLTRQ